MGELTVLDVTSSLCNKDTVVCVIAPDVVVVGPYYCKDVAVFNYYLVSSFTWHHGNRVAIVLDGLQEGGAADV